MTRVVAAPYLQARDGVEAGPWSVTVRGETTENPLVLSGWDYATTLRLTSTVAVEPNSVREQCELGPRARLALVALWSSSSTNLRCLAAQAELGDEATSVLIDFDIEPGVAGGRLTLERRLVLIEPANGGSELAATQPGAVLWREHGSTSTTLILEGDATRFPTEPVDFAKLPHLAASDAVWWLLADLTDLGATPLGAVRLYVNESNPVVRRLLEGVADDQTRSLSEVLEWDVARSLIDRALDDADFSAAWGAFAAGSLGQTLQILIQKVLPGHDLDSVRALRAADRGLFDARLQASLRPFGAPR
jgi:hypothetical protein